MISCVGLLKGVKIYKRLNIIQGEMKVATPASGVLSVYVSLYGNKVDSGAIRVRQRIFELCMRTRYPVDLS
jgi:hypothetical protein